MMTRIPFLLLLAVLVVGCGSGANDEAMADPTPTPEPQPTAACLQNKSAEFPGCYLLETDVALPCCDGSVARIMFSGSIRTGFDRYACCDAT